MARGINKVILVGNLGGDPETKFTQGGMCICSISVATSTVRKDKDGTPQERTEWHRVKLFGKLGEIAGEYLRKGRQVYIEGSIRYDKFTGQDGVEKYFTDIIADEMQMLGGGGGDDSQSGSGAERQSRAQGDSRGASNGSRGTSGGRNAGGGNSAPARRAPAARSGGDDFQDDDIPF